MNKLHSKHLANKVNSYNSQYGVDQTKPPELLTDMESQILRIQSQFQSEVPLKTTIPIAPEFFAVSPTHIFLSNSSGDICLLEQETKNVIKFTINCSISSMSFCEMSNSLYISGDGLYSINISKQDIETQILENVNFCRFFKGVGYLCQSGLISKLNTLSSSPEILYEHYNASALDISSTALASLAPYKLMVFIDKVVFEYENFDSSASNIKVSDTYIAIGGQFNYILLIKIGSWEIQNICNANYNIRYGSIDINSQFGLMIAVSDQGVIAYDIKTDRIPFSVYPRHMKYPICGFLSSDKFFSCSDNMKLKIFQTPLLEDGAIIKDIQMMKDCVIVDNKAVAFNEKCVYNLSLVDGHSELVYMCDEDEKIDFGGSTGSELYLVMGSRFKILSSSFSLIQSWRFDSQIIIAENLPTGFALVIDMNVKILDSSSHVLHEWTVIKDKITASCTSDQALYLASSGGMIRAYSFNNYTEQVTFYTHKPYIKVLAHLQAHNYLLISTTDNYIYIWDMKSVQYLFAIYNRLCNKIIPSFDSYHFYVQSFDSKIEIWDANDFCIHSTISVPSDVTAFGLSLTEDLIIAGSKEMVFLLNNPLTCKKIQPFGRNQNTAYLFKKFFLSLFKNASVEKASNYTDWLISPYQICFSTMIAYFNKIEILKNCARDISLHPGTSSDTIVSICLNKNFIDSLESIFKSFKTKIKNNPFCFYYLEKSLLELNKKSVPCLHKLYGIAMGNSFLGTLPKFCIDDSYLPIEIESESIIIEPSRFMPLENYASLGRSIKFTQTFVKINLNLGSQESIDFMESLIICENKLIIKTELIQTILNNKWKRIKILIMIQSLIYVVYIVALAMFSTTYFNGNFLIFPFVISQLLLIYEVFQMIPGPLNYLQDIWNIIDLSRAALFIAYSIEFWQNNDGNREMLSIIVFLTWIRGITYFRIFDSTRYYVNLLFVVIKDMIAFFIIFFYSIVGFGLVFFAFDEESDYFDYLTGTFNLSFGDINTDGYNKLQWLYYFFFMVLNPIVELNLLISIMSDTYSRVQENLEIADSLGLCSLIIEIERLFFWRRRLNNKSYIHKCDIERFVAQENTESSQIKDLKRTVKDIALKITQQNDNLARTIEGLKSSQFNTYNTLLEMKRQHFK
ncbi:hypothetical protein SteCoe_13602 [Stentor coeruleus]|uniref:Ion transport domain-containing protein n=1 Tax=Stentor coeruleus TaxID=5963 RepID=A0A1R2C805_9CILI|nr:hypothetical protein SteCoe_13602 [Stentor coeruleus]